MDINKKKGSVLMVLEILKKLSDCDHPLTQLRIVELIKQNYNIDVDRRTVASDLELLSLLNFDIAKDKKGYYLSERLLDNTEVSFIIDALFSSKSLDSKSTKALTKKVCSVLSKYEQKNYDYIKKSEEVNKGSNLETLYNVSIITEAIERHKMIRFQYLEYDNNGKESLRMDGYDFSVSPYYMISNSGRYYLLCNYRSKMYQDIQTFRIDYMKNIKIREDHDRVELKDLPNVGEGFSITKYINEHIYPFGGESIKAVLELKDNTAIKYVKDWFGSNAVIKNIDGRIETTITCNENALFFWIMQYSGCVKVLSPEALINKVKERGQKILDDYN